ncbi:carboxypeptidase regulatory-like domain-containing protein [Nocardioides sp. W7]|uniref:Ig-like domain repeat protein n=1 Tax=Nocardioides sp. W7 TaxID=2931390 RepID=UPI001FD29763|nr:carboxypeptidase regulatory-like domain-containing protein [Nocardioides sp. W7]
MNARRFLIPLALSGLLGTSVALTPTQAAQSAPAALPSLADTESGKHAVTGTVTDGQGRPLEGTVSVSRLTGSYWSTFLGDPIADGKIALALGPGQYRFHFADAADSTRWEYYDNTQDWNASTAVTVTDTAVELNPVVLESPPMITGRVVDTGGRPVAGVDVRAFAATAPHGGYYSTVSRPDGTFRFSPPAGAWKLQLSDYRERYASEWADDSASHAAGRTVAFDRTADVSVGDLTVAAGGSIGGRVTSDGGTPLRRVLVTAYDADGRTVSSDYTDRTGTYVVPRLTDGPWKLRFVDDYNEYGAEWLGDATSPEASTPVSVVGGASVVLADTLLSGGVRPAPAGADLTGVVRDEQGRPAMGVDVRAYSFLSDGEPRNQAEWTITDRDGRYYFMSLDRSGPRSYKIQVEDSRTQDVELSFQDAWYGGGTGRTAAPVTVTPGQVTTGVDVSVTPWGGIRGVVTDDAGQPLDNVSVSVHDSSGRYVDDYNTYDGGRYEIEELRPGVPYLLSFTSWDGHVSEWYSDASTPGEAQLVTPRSGEYATANVVLDSSLRTRTAPTIGGTPLVGQQLSANPGRWNASAGVTFRVEWLRGGTVVGTGPSYVLTAADAGSSLQLRVAASAPDEAGETGGFTGTATSAPTGLVQHVSSTRLTAKAKRRTVRLAVQVTAPGATGPVVLRDGSRVVGRVALKAGRAKLTLKRQKRGAHRYTASYAGTATVAGSTATAVVKVRR